jgi:hypothetical protein
MMIMIIRMCEAQPVPPPPPLPPPYLQGLLIGDKQYDVDTHGEGKFQTFTGGHDEPKMCTLSSGLLIEHLIKQICKMIYNSSSSYVYCVNFYKILKAKKCFK